MKQTTFASAASDKKGKVMRRERFLAEMNAVIPWSGILALIEPHYPKAGNGTSRCRWSGCCESTNSRDPEMRQGKKNDREWHFGMKAHVGTGRCGIVRNGPKTVLNSPLIPIEPARAIACAGFPQTFR